MKWKAKINPYWHLFMACIHFIHYNVLWGDSWPCSLPPNWRNHKKMLTMHDVDFSSSSYLVNVQPFHLYFYLWIYQVNIIGIGSKVQNIFFISDPDWLIWAWVGWLPPVVWLLICLSTSQLFRVQSTYLSPIWLPSQITTKGCK